MTMVDTDPPVATHTEPSVDPDRRPWSRRRRELGDHVARTVSVLQAQVLRTVPHPEAVSALARLRRGIGRAPGFDFTLERYLQVPEHLLGYQPPEDATDAEYAVHDAVTLYADAAWVGPCPTWCAGPPDRRGYAAGSPPSAPPAPTTRASTTCAA